MVREFYFDKSIFISFLLLLIIGTVFIYSATFTMADSFYYIKRHLIAVFLGVIAGLVAYLLPSSFWKKMLILFLHCPFFF